MGKNPNWLGKLLNTSPESKTSEDSLQGKSTKQPKDNTKVEATKTTLSQSEIEKIAKQSETVVIQRKAPEDLLFNTVKYNHPEIFEMRLDKKHDTVVFNSSSFGEMTSELQAIGEIVKFLARYNKTVIFNGNKEEE